jgi:hypothetical protein
MSYVAIKIGAWLITGLAAFTLLWDASGAAQKPPPIVGQITTNLNSTPPIVVLTPLPTTTTTTVPKGCAQYVADAITAGWPADQAPMLACDVSESHGASQRPTTVKTPQAAHTGCYK